MWLSGFIKSINKVDYSGFQILNQPCMPGVNLIIVWCMLSIAELRLLIC